MNRGGVKNGDDAVGASTTSGPKVVSKLHCQGAKTSKKIGGKKQKKQKTVENLLNIKKNS